MHSSKMTLLFVPVLAREYTSCQLTQTKRPPIKDWVVWVVSTQNPIPPLRGKGGSEIKGGGYHYSTKFKGVVYETYLYILGQEVL